MKTNLTMLLIASTAVLIGPASADELTLESVPPVVVRTVPTAGDAAVDPALTELKVTFSKAMHDGTWSWSAWGAENCPEMVGQPKYLADGRTCVAQVKLQPGKLYALWLNSEKFHGFQDTSNQPALPYLLTFITAATNAAAPTDKSLDALNAEQRAVLAWTDRQFRSFFDARTFDGWSEQQRTELETRCIDTLKGPQSKEYFQAINTLGALRATNALPALRIIAFDSADKNNRERWMAVRSLGLIGDSADVPELITLVYHGNANTRWWAQISLVRLTGQNFGGDWNAWAKWWDERKGQPAYNPEIVRWWNGQAEPDKLAASLAESDQKFLADLQPK